ncbi:MAG: hypothetical protein JO001_01410 [Alphaproteobacteria bacterium]|nr:hypothetical protein [Alphaproteobacteria bacterium]
MVSNDAEIERLAREMIGRYGQGAARVAAEHLNDMIDRDNAKGRDFWACVVHEIHQHQGTGPLWADFPYLWEDIATPLGLKTS